MSEDKCMIQNTSNVFHFPTCTLTTLCPVLNLQMSTNFRQDIAGRGSDIDMANVLPEAVSNLPRASPPAKTQCCDTSLTLVRPCHFRVLQSRHQKIHNQSQVPPKTKTSRWSVRRNQTSRASSTRFSSSRSAGKAIIRWVSNLSQPTS
jgi:hypothetical protein